MLMVFELQNNALDSVEIAAELGSLLKGLPVLLNVIPYNPTDVPYDYKPPTRIGADAFVAKVREDEVLVILRQTMGQVSSKCNLIVLGYRVCMWPASRQ
jgi:adenine C2-methylase RlmN of 23S rRNA A2503 and tRNA A37